MGDDLDALFGAFDGDVDEDEKKQDGRKEQEAEETNATADVKEDVTNKKKIDEDDGDGNDNDKDKPNPDDNKTTSTIPPPTPTPEEEETQPNKKPKTTPQDSTSPTTTNASQTIRAIPIPTSLPPKPPATPTTPSPQPTPKPPPRAAISTGTSHDKSIRSYTALPPTSLHPSAPAAPPSSSPPAKTYPYTLDPFQQKSISYIASGQSVLVAAHTSAGKTAVAEYAIAQSLQNHQRVIYTSPIKALSNQKYRDLQEEFTDVGLMTGDITINPDATCLVMTTEILRSMLYRGSELVREVAWVVYDEVHYMRDSERGVVWEESIVLLPHKVKFVFLSATIPNANQFARWIAKVHRQPCHVVSTNYRPTPLQHYVFAQGGDGLHLVVDERGEFREGNFQRAMALLQGGGEESGAAAGGERGRGKRKRRSGGGRGGMGGGGGERGNTDLHRIVKLVMERGLNPVIVFSFSKKDCERYALELNKEDYTDDVEKDLIGQVYRNAIESLGEDDRKLPQVEALLPLLKKGIGIHHGGLLPILKEIVEILFSEGLIKALFATETFAIGINMPAKTVVFTNTRKWDGKAFRWVSSGEYIQMSGRAGRRGKDDRGIVIQMMDEKMEPDVCKSILYGESDPLNSSYKISYNMLLNMMRVEDVDPEYILRASFFQFQQESEAPQLEERADELEERARGIEIGKAWLVEQERVEVGDEEMVDGEGKEDSKSSKVKHTAEEMDNLVGEYHGLNHQLLLTERRLHALVRQSQYVVPFLQMPGRMLDISIDGQRYGWGTLVSYRKKTVNSAGTAGRDAALAGKATPVHVLEVLLPCVDRHFDETQNDDPNNTDKPTEANKAERQEDKSNVGLLWRGTPRHCRPTTSASSSKPQSEAERQVTTMRVFTVSLSNINHLSAVRLFVPNDVHSPNARKNVQQAVDEVQRRFPEGVPLLDDAKDLGVKGDDYEKLTQRAGTLRRRLAEHSLHTDVSDACRETMVRNYGIKADLLERVKTVRNEARARQGMVKRDELKKMKRVLRTLGHVDANGVIQMKGRTACEINTTQELVAVELMFTGVFNDLTVEQSVALMSCMTFDERMKEEDGDPAGGLKSYLSSPFYKLQDCARTVAKAMGECKLEVDEDEFVMQFNPGLMEAVFAWCKGAKFVDVQKLTGTFEGTTIRTLRRLDELIRQLSSAAKAIGNHELEAKFEKGSELLKRDIVFCSSLYL